jgi:opacity protein-like surface antigen
MKKTVIMTVVALTLAASQTFAAGPYVGGFGGATITHDSDITVSGVGTATLQYDVGPVVGVVGGYNFDGFRVEGESSYRHTNVKSVSGFGNSVLVSGVDLSTWSLMGNGYFDFKNNSPVTPFIGAGMGLVTARLNDNGYQFDDTVFGYQFMVGAAFALNNRISLDLSYRLQGTSDLNTLDGKISYMSSNILFGMRYQF